MKYSMLSRSFLEFSWQFCLKYCCLSQNCSHIFRDKPLYKNITLRLSFEVTLFVFLQTLEQCSMLLSLPKVVQKPECLFTLRLDLRQISVGENSFYRGTGVSFYITHPNKARPCTSRVMVGLSRGWPDLRVISTCQN